MIENGGEPQEMNLDHEQLVPVTEAIRYRKRAQAAEQELQGLQQEFQKQQQQLADLQVHTQLSEGLMAQGANDLKVAVLLGQDKRRAKPDMPLNELIEELKNERPGLFGSAPAAGMLGMPTATVRGGTAGGTVRLEQAARQVRQSGSRKDMQDYLRLRRHVTPR